MTDASTTASANPVTELPFPPSSLQEFLQLRDGRWMSLRSPLLSMAPTTGTTARGVR